ncbi:MAG TPA: hypothetical protein VLQ45_32735, partial [Thermoanaerobaculia bacterium]|nr:hypothetical protein [Thermoanaerobaculia bacterium]
MTEIESPRLLPTTKTFRSGYGARAITLSRDQKTLFVGCKDGSVTVIDLVGAMADDPADEKTWKLRPPGRDSSGLCWIYDLKGSSLGEGELLLGDDLGRLILLKWARGPEGIDEQSSVVADFPDAGACAPITFADDWDESRLLVSYRDRDARLVPRSQLARRMSADRMAELPVLKGVQGVCGMMRNRGMDPLLICENGALWQVGKARGRWTPKLLEGCCEEPEQPGFISDTMQVALDSSSGHRGQLEVRVGREALYLATDLGLYRLRWHGDRAEVRKVHLPGLSGTCMAVSYVKKDNRHFLWVSDLAGDVHMFWNQSDREDEAPLYWQRYGFRLESSRAVRSISSFGLSETTAFAICQASRDEKVVVTWYGVEPRDPGNASHVLAWGSVEELRKWRPDLRSDRLLWDEWCSEARLAACIDQAGGEPGQLAQFLSSPQPERLAWEILREIGSVERGRQAVSLWTDALLGTVHRRLERRREQQSLGVVRWLRRLAERCRHSTGSEAWMRDLLGDIEECIRHARKWGVFGATFSQRKEVFAPLAALGAQQVGERQLDSIVYRTLLFGRRVDVEDEKPEQPRQRRVPWDIQYLP